MRTDVCLILEGTYPYVAGGVSTWVQQILEAMPQYHFSILYIGARSSEERVVKYRIPANVVDIQEVFVHDYPAPLTGSGQSRTLPHEAWAEIGKFCSAIAEGRYHDIRSLVRIMEGLDDGVFMDMVSRSHPMWEIIKAQYLRHAPPETSFLDYFWTHRIISIPALNLMRTRLPRARVYHAACTGYAGLLGAIAAARHRAPFILTEHGIYTRERRIEIFNAEWIRDLRGRSNPLDLRRRSNFLKEWWINFFQSMSAIAYRASSRILSLFEANRQAQIQDSAKPEKVRVIPNGIDTSVYGNLPPASRPAGAPLRIGYIGRIAAIKDVKTLLRALDGLQRRQVDFTAAFLGPMDEEEDYARECRELAQALNLGEKVRFTGRVDVRKYMPGFDVVVLSSISEGLPFVILEANCASRPVIATDVGACRDLLEGATPEDREIGPSGLVVPVASPPALANALAKLAGNPELCQRMGLAGRERVRSYYDIEDVIAEYQELYEWYFYTSRSAPVSLRRSRKKQLRITGYELRNRTPSFRQSVIRNP